MPNINTFANDEGITRQSDMNPFMLDDARDSYRDRLNEEEQWRLGKQVCANRCSSIDRLCMHIDDRLIAMGR